MLFRIILALLAASSTSLALAQITIVPAPKPPTEAEVKEQLQRLDPKKHDKAKRQEALKWLGARLPEKSRASAMPIVECCIRHDPDKEVRSEAVRQLAYNLTDLRQSCPLALLEALLDKDQEVGVLAAECVGFFSTYPPGSVDILLRSVRSQNRDVRSSILEPLQRAGGKDKKVLEALDKARQDPDFVVRHNAHCTMFRADDDLAVFLGYIIKFRQDPDGVVGPIDKNSDIGKRTLIARNLGQIGFAFTMIEWSEKRPNDFGPALLKYLDDPSPTMRSGAAGLIGASIIWIDPEYIEKLKRDIKWGGTLPKQTEKPEGPPRLSKVGILLEQKKARERLRQLRDNDPDPTVRAAADYALRRFALVEDKKK